MFAYKKDLCQLSSSTLPTACRYEKGSWSECATGQMTRADKLKASSDPSCEATRVIKKNCKPGKSKDKSAKEQRKNKDKGNLTSCEFE